MGHHSEDKVRQLIAGNWKMNGLMPQLAEIEAVAASVTAKLPPANVLICTPATLITRAVQVAAGRIGVGEDRTATRQSRVHSSSDIRRAANIIARRTAEQIAGSMPGGLTSLIGGASLKATGFEDIIRALSGKAESSLAA